MHALTAKVLHGTESWEGLECFNAFLEILRGVILDWLGWTTGNSILHLRDKMEGWNWIILMIASTEKGSGYTSICAICIATVPKI
jgi:hypothetical protein